MMMPSTRTGEDPLRCVMRDGSICPYQPIPLGDLKLTHWMRYKIYRSRKKTAIIDTPSYDKKLSIIVPYRHREEHLKIFPAYLHKFLNSEKIKHKIFIIEQHDNKPFNRAKLLNVGASLAMDQHDYFCFHDIDMLPQTATYAYINHPLLLANSVSQFDIESNHPTYFSGAILLTKKDLVKTNGFSNQYWHWGGEDDDFLMRCLLSGLTPVAYKEGRFQSLPHKKTVTQTADGSYHEDEKTIAYLDTLYQKNKQRYKRMRRGVTDFQHEGLNTLQYKIVNQEQHELYTKIAVEL
jgi:hypothetical protein